MPYAVEMFFDMAGDPRIRGLWEEFAALGTPSMRDSGARPHISLAVCDSVAVPAACQLIDRFATATFSFPVALSSMGLFPAAAPVAYLAPKVTSELLSLHARFYSEFAVIAHQCWSHYSPSAWVPHCTLACGLPTQQLSPALEIGRAAELPILCTVTEIGLVEFHPVKQLHATSLSHA
jgi:2'-5' RNA ligase